MIWKVKDLIIIAVSGCDTYKVEGLVGHVFPQPRRRNQSDQGVEVYKRIRILCNRNHVCCYVECGTLVSHLLTIKPILME